MLCKFIRELTGFGELKFCFPVNFTPDMLRFSHFFHLTGRRKRNPQDSFQKCSNTSILKVKLVRAESNRRRTGRHWELGQLVETGADKVVNSHLGRYIFIITSFKPISFRGHSFANFYFFKGLTNSGAFLWTALQENPFISGRVRLGLLVYSEKTLGIW